MFRLAFFSYPRTGVKLEATADTARIHPATPGICQQARRCLPPTSPKRENERSPRCWSRADRACRGLAEEEVANEAIAVEHGLVSLSSKNMNEPAGRRGHGRRRVVRSRPQAMLLALRVREERERSANAALMRPPPCLAIAGSRKSHTTNGSAPRR